MFNFPSVAAFLAGTANAFNITLGERRSLIDQRAVGLFVQDQVTVRDSLTLELGMRYEWHVTPTERDNRFVVFDAARASLVRVGVDVDEIYEQNNRNFEPRVGVAWQVSSDGRTVLRAAYARAVDQPGTTAVRDTAGNPPFGDAADGVRRRFRSPARSTRRGPPGSRRPPIDPRFRNASLQSWNVNVQRQLARDLAATVGYLGSRGTRPAHLAQHQSAGERRSSVRRRVGRPARFCPAPRSATSRRWRAAAFRTTTRAWVSVTKRLSRGLQFDTSYTWSKSLDTNSLNSSGFAVQDSYDIAERVRPVGLRRAAPVRASAPSTHLPFTGHALTRGWQVAAVVQSQSGNPVNIVTSNSSLNGLPNTVRPDVAGPIRIIGSVGPVVRSVGVRGRQSLRQSGQKRRHRTRPSTTPICRS